MLSGADEEEEEEEEEEEKEEGNPEIEGGAASRVACFSFFAFKLGPGGEDEESPLPDPGGGT